MSPTVTPRAAPLHPPVDSFVTLQQYIDRRLASIESDLGDGEWCQHAGIRGQDRLTAYRTTLLDIQFEIREAVAAEAEQNARLDAQERPNLYDPSEGESVDPPGWDGAGADVEAARG